MARGTHRRGRLMYERPQRTNAPRYRADHELATRGRDTSATPSRYGRQRNHSCARVLQSRPTASRDPPSMCCRSLARRARTTGVIPVARARSRSLMMEASSFAPERAPPRERPRPVTNGRVVSRLRSKPRLAALQHVRSRWVLRRLSPPACARRLPPLHDRANALLNQHSSTTTRAPMRSQLR